MRRLAAPSEPRPRGSGNRHRSLTVAARSTNDSLGMSPAADYNRSVALTPVRDPPMLSPRLAFLLLLGTLLGPLPARADDPAWSPEKRNHWAWKPPVRPAVPAVGDRGWVQNPIDAFILARLEAQGLRPAPPAGPEVLLRRLSFDLIGLPPTPEEVDAFARETRANPQAALAAAV